MPFSRYTPRERAYSALGEEDDQLLEKTTPPTTRYSPKTTNKPRTGVLMKYLPFALFNITLGLATGYWLAALKSGSSSSSNGINTTTTTNELGPEPSVLQQIMRTRHDVPFSPNYDYMGPSAEAKANWVALTKSMSEFLFFLFFLPLPPNRPTHQLIHNHPDIDAIKSSPQVKIPSTSPTRTPSTSKTQESGPHSSYSTNHLPQQPRRAIS